jgi:hypothetical protein
MAKKIFYIVIGGLVIFGVLFLLWSWLFSGNKSAQQNNGQFGSGTDINGGDGSGSDTTGNGQVGLGQAGQGQNSGNGQVPLNGSGGTGTGSTGGTGTTGTGGSTGIQTGSGATLGFDSTSLSTNGVIWLYGKGPTVTTVISTSSTGGGSPNLSGYDPTNINGVNGGTVGGTVPTIGGGVPPDTGGSNSQLNTLLISGLIGAASCALQASGNTIGSFISGGTVAALNPTALTAVPVSDFQSHTLEGAQAADRVGKNVITFQGCITNVLAKAALQQITVSVVNWINSGFNGQPSFITNYQQFFTNVADVAAGEFIKGAGLSFLCSPFKPQIKIAIAQSYAQRNNSAQSCTLTKVIKNVNGFMNGNFAQGGWQGFLSFTTMPTNNPYGSYVYGQIGLANAQQQALANAKNNISPTGFLNVQQTYNCKTGTGTNGQAVANGTIIGQSFGAQCPSNCSCRTTTPGSIIESTLSSTLDTPLKQLGLANSLDQIMNALTTQLITKTLQNGLSNLSGNNGYQSNYQTPEQAQAQQQAQGILNSLGGHLELAQQYGSIAQGSIRDIQNAQGQLTTLANCWTTVASSTNSTEAGTKAANALTSSATLEGQVSLYNDTIVNVNQLIATILDLQSEALSVSSVADVSALSSHYESSKPFVSQADVNTVSQNRVTLQSQMSALNQSTQASLTQCKAAAQ